MITTQTTFACTKRGQNSVNMYEIISRLYRILAKENEKMRHISMYVILR